MVVIAQLLCYRIVVNHCKTQKLLKSEHMAGDFCVSVVKKVITHSSPDAVVVDLKTSGIRWSISTSKSHRHCEQ